MRPTVALLPSALLGPAVWSPVGDRLGSRGWSVVHPPPLRTAPGTRDDVLDWYLGAVPADRPVVVVPHSNAGLYLPALTRRRQVVAMVYVDAGLPPREGTFPVAPVELFEFLARLADNDGMLPVWSRWWGDEVAGLFPGQSAQRAVEAEQVKLPLRYFAESLSAGEGWDERPAGYLAFGETYRADRDEAVTRGWPTATLAGRHLHMLVEPADVAEAIDAMLTEVLETGRRR